MLAQHLVMEQVFNALFPKYGFRDNNPVARAMERVIAVFNQYGFQKELEQLADFYQQVRATVRSIDSLSAKQTIIKNLYEFFFKAAFAETVKKLGVVYTPIECVDYIIRSVDALLRKHFNTSLTQEGVHILDPFTGTGTFIARLLQLNLIQPKDLLRKYQTEIHANELILLAYYIADVNIETVFNDIYSKMPPDIVGANNHSPYYKFDGINLTDTFNNTFFGQPINRDPDGEGPNLFAPAAAGGAAPESTAVAADNSGSGPRPAAEGGNQLRIPNYAL